MGDVVAAVDRYRDIPADVRARLKARMAKRDYEDIVSIRRDSISGRAEYGSAISDMHFGTHQICRNVTRSSWSPQMQERGLVYCDSGQCILVPTVCRNVGRITRKSAGKDLAERPANPPVAPSQPLAMDDSPSFATPLDFPPTGYGVPPSNAAPPGGGGLAPGAAPEGGGVPGEGGLFPGLFPGPWVEPVIIGPGVNPVMPLQAVPEPQTWVLMLGATVALAFIRRHRVRR